MTAAPHPKETTMTAILAAAAGAITGTAGGIWAALRTHRRREQRRRQALERARQARMC